MKKLYVVYYDSIGCKFYEDTASDHLMYFDSTIDLTQLKPFIEDKDKIHLDTDQKITIFNDFMETLSKEIDYVQCW